MNNSLTVIFVSLNLFFFSCNEQIIQTPDKDPWFESTLIPLEVGNQWIYIDSVLTTTIYRGDTTTTLNVSTDTLIIVSSRLHRGDTIYTPNEYTFPLHLYLSILERNDSVFEVQGVDPNWNLILNFRYFAPLMDGEFEIYPGYIASRQNKILNTKVGTFPMYYLYLEEGRDSTFIVPKVGIVKRVNVYTENRIYQLTTIHTSTLIGYLLNP